MQNDQSCINVYIFKFKIITHCFKSVLRIMIEIHVGIKQFQERDQLYIYLVIILCSVYDYEWKLFSIYSEVYILELLNWILTRRVTASVVMLLLCLH